MYKRLQLILCLSVVLFGLFTGGCSSKDPADSIKPQEEVKEVITLKFADTAMPGTYPHSVLEHLLNQFEEKTQGRVKIERYYGGTLAKDPKEEMSLVRSGAVDIISGFPAFFKGPEEIPLNALLQQPFWSSFEKGVYGNNKMAFEIPETAKMLTEEANRFGLQPIVWHSLGSYGMITGFPLKSLDDLKGKKVNAYGEYDIVRFKQLGVIPVSLVPSDIYESLSRKLIDGANSATYNLIGFKIYELGKTFLITDEVISSGPIYMNLKKWNSLPPDIQKAFNDVRNEHIKWILDYATSEEKNMIETARKAGLDIYRLTEEEKTKINNAKDIVSDLKVEQYKKYSQELGANAELWQKNWKQLNE